VGRINVGKSTLFNRISRKRTAIVKDEPGTTRDRIYAECEWKGKQFILVDSGGIDLIKKEKIQKKITDQTKLAIKEADLIILLVDLKEGINQDDFDVVKMIRKKNKANILVANKGDIKERNQKLYEFYELGLGEPLIISAEQRLNIDNLLDRIVSIISDQTMVSKEESDDNDIIKISILGKPNVGKSSLLNCILGEDRSIVNELPGTTRDAIEVTFKSDKLKAIFVDTAGLRSRSKKKEDIEYYSTIRTIKAVNDSDIGLLILDSTQGISMQDKKIASYIKRAGRACIIILNKYDIIDDKTKNNWLIEEVRHELSFIRNSPIIFTSALINYNIDKVILKVKEVAFQYNKKIPTPKLNNFIKEIVAENPPKYIRGGILKIYYATQAGIKPPKFLLFVNNPSLIYDSYYKYIENQIYKSFGFEGSPIILNLIKKDRK
jgi:GTP-binding protein